MRFLWDASLLIARVFSRHPHHSAARVWTSENPDFAVCPITQGALIRYCFQSSENGRIVAEESLGMLRELSGYALWPDDLSYESVDLTRLTGHKQVTDAYLVALAAAHGGRLATFDRALAALHPEAVLVPAA